MTLLYTPEDHAAATRFFDEHVAPGKLPAWVKLNRDHCIREHARWCRFERERAEHRQADPGVGKQTHRRKAA